MRTQARADRIAFSGDMQGMTDLLLNDMVPAVDAFRKANFASTEEMRRAIQTSPAVRQAFELLAGSTTTLHLNTDLVREGLDAMTLAALGNGSATVEQVNELLRFIEALHGVRRAFRRSRRWVRGSVGCLLLRVLRIRLRGLRGTLRMRSGSRTTNCWSRSGMRGKLDMQLRLLTRCITLSRLSRSMRRRLLR
jgi:hypothetical protein